MTSVVQQPIESHQSIGIRTRQALPHHSLTMNTQSNPPADSKANKPDESTHTLQQSLGQRGQFPMREWKDYIMNNQQHNISRGAHIRQLDSTVLKMAATIMDQQAKLVAQDEEILELKKQVL